MKKLLFLLLGAILFFNSVYASSSGNNIKIYGLSTYTCYTDQECTDNNSLTSDTCINPGTETSYCSNSEIICFSDSDCGFTGFIGDSFCYQNDVFSMFQNSECINPGTVQSYCSNSTSQELKQDCGEDYCENPSENFCRGNNWCHGTDLNKDNKVNVLDFRIITKYMGNKCSAKNKWCDNNDINKDGKVNGQDLIKVLFDIGSKDCSQSSVYNPQKCYIHGCSLGECFSKLRITMNKVTNCENECSNGVCVN